MTYGLLQQAVKGLGLFVVVLLLNSPAYADRGSSAYKHGEHAEHENNFDAAHKYYKEAHTLSPGNAKYFAAYTRMRFRAAAEHVHNGQVFFNSGALKDALVEFQRAVEIDSSDFLAQQELRRTADLMRQKEKQASPKIESPLAKLAAEVGESVELQPVSTGPITFKMTASAEVVYKTLCKLAGINVLFDPDYRPQKISIDLNDVTLLQALDMLRLQSKSFWRPVLANTILVSADSPAKRKELEQNVMKTFYLRNISTPNELQEAATVVGKMLDVNRVQLLQSQDALMVRGTMDQLVLVEKVLADIDKPKSEVVIDVAVMSVNRDRVRNLGTNFPTSATIAYLPNISNNGSSSTSGSGGYTITAGSFATVIPPITLTALASDSNSKVLQNPEIRVLNDEKATLRIGDRVPIATGSFQPGVVGAGAVSPLISTQFQYLDVGVNIDITPHIHGDREVTLKMSLEISSVNGQELIGGISQPIIGQRRIEHEVRLADGEVNLLGGILEDSETHSLSGLPWASKIPLLKYLFAQDNKDHQETEVVFAITPHIIRSLEITAENERMIDVGTGSSIELHRKATPPTPPVSTAAHAADAAKPRPSAAQTPPASVPAPGSSVPTLPAQASAQNKPGAALAPASSGPNTPAVASPQNVPGAALAPSSSVPNTPLQVNPQNKSGAALAPASSGPNTPAVASAQNVPGAALAPSSSVPVTPALVSTQNAPKAAPAPTVLAGLTPDSPLAPLGKAIPQWWEGRVRRPVETVSGTNYEGHASLSGPTPSWQANPPNKPGAAPPPGSVLPAVTPDNALAPLGERIASGASRVRALVGTIIVTNYPVYDTSSSAPPTASQANPQSKSAATPAPSSSAPTTPLRRGEPYDLIPF